MEIESQSKLVQDYAGAALARCRMQGVDHLPEGKKVIMLVSKDIQEAKFLRDYWYIDKEDFNNKLWEFLSELNTIIYSLMKGDKYGELKRAI